MKIRQGFVTNSSSSSFIIKSKKEVPKDIASNFTRFTKDNFKEQYLSTMCSYFEYDYIFSCFDEEREKKLIKLLKLTPEQITLMKLEKHDLLDEYLELQEEIDNMPEDEFLYYLYADRDWLYYQDAINSFINESEVLEHKTDL